MAGQAERVRCHQRSRIRRLQRETVAGGERGRGREEGVGPRRCSQVRPQLFIGRDEETEAVERCDHGRTLACRPVLA